MNQTRKRKPLPYLLLLPMVLLFTTFTFYPFLRSIFLSFFVTDPLGNPATFVGLRNYERVMTTSGFSKSIVSTVKFALMVGVGTFSLAMVLALLCIKPQKGSRIYQTMYSLPIAVASVPVSALASYILAKYGILNQILGTDIAWLSTEATALAACAAVTIWSGVGTSFIFLLVGFRNVPDELLECARLDGAGSIRRIVHVILPLASPQVFFVIFLNIVNSFKAFAIIKLLTQKGPNDSTNIMVYAIYSNAFLRGRFETACVYSLVLCAIIFVVTRIQLLCEKRMVHYQ